MDPSRGSERRRRPNGGRIVVLAALYVVLAELGLRLAGPPGNVSAVFPASGLALGAILVWGRRPWPGILLGSFAVNLRFLLTHDATLPAALATSAAIGAGSTLQALAGAWLLERVIGRDDLFARPAAVFTFGIIEAAACTIAAAAGTGALAAGGFLPPDATFTTATSWYLGDLTGVLVIAPAIVCGRGILNRPFRPSRAVEAVLLGAALIAAGSLPTSLPEGGLDGATPSVFLPLLVWAAVRFGRRGVTLATVAASVLMALRAYSALDDPTVGPARDLIWLPVFAGGASLTGLLIATAFAELRSAHRRLDEARHDLERRVRERTAEVAEHAALVAGLFERAPDAILAVDRSGIVMRANERVEAVFGWHPDELVGRPVEVLLPERFREAHVGHRAGYGGRPRVRPMGAERDLHALRRDGTHFPVDIMLSPLDTSGGPVVIAIVRDITGRRDVERRLRRTGEQLRALAAHTQDVAEQERTRIAREVHDQLGQALTGLKMELAWIARQLAAGGAAAAEDAGARAVEMLKLTDTMIDSVRRIASDLRPGLLDDVGLADALQWQAREFERRTGVSCAIRSALGDPALPRPVETALFRIFQEILTNVARHAGGTAVHARLAADAATVTLEVRDNGRGITEEEVSGRRSLGILGMRERAAMLGGSVRFASDGRGTTVRVRVPHVVIPEAEARDETVAAAGRAEGERP